VKGSRETTGEGEGIAQIPNQRRKIFNMTVKEKAVGKRTRASIQADVVAPIEGKEVVGTLGLITVDEIAAFPRRNRK
jgi:hypothetical protein